MRQPSTPLVCAFFLLLLLSTSSSSSARAAPLVNTSVPKEEKRFIPFDSYRIEAGSIINVPLQCPSDKVKVGNRCRSVF